MDSIDFNEVSWASWLTPVDDAPNRESWLMEAVERMSTSLFPMFKRPASRVTCGWPKGVRGGKHAIGQCWPTASADGTSEMFISPELDDPIEILHVLAHEMVHAIVGTEARHKGELVKLCKKIGLVAPWTATTPGPELTKTLAVYALQLGPYPHARLNADTRKKQGARLLKAVCPNPQCPIVLKLSKPLTAGSARKWPILACRCALAAPLRWSSPAGLAKA